MNKQQYYMFKALETEGVTYRDAQALRRISMTLHRWHEMGCGTEHGCIERDEETGAPYFRTVKGTRYRTRDMETGALRRLDAIMARYPHLTHYVQGDPRGCALYILRMQDIIEELEADSYYNRGIAVY